jgi:rhamnosyltransferase
MMNEKLTAQSICAVFVTYNPRPTFIKNIEAVAAQVNRVVVVDNGSLGETGQHLQELEARLGCEVIRNRQNLGVATALNLGVNYATEAGYDWVCTFDQDSRVCEEFFSKMLGAYQHAPHPERIALLTPLYVDRESGITVRLRRARNGEILTTLTSGSMIPSSAIRKLGLFDESLYIDAVDTEYCLRARQSGMMILQSDAVLSHSLGRTTYHQLLGLRFGTTNHSPGRHYYITRNRLRLLARYAADWPWVWREVRGMLFDDAKIILVEPNKWKKFRAMAAGAADALNGKFGKQIEL